MKTRGRRKVVIGVVTSNSMQQTISVLQERFVKHPRYGKYIRKRTVYKAHDEKNEAKVGAKVQIMAARPISKTKRWRLVGILEQPAEIVIHAPAAVEAPKAEGQQ